MRSHWWGSIGDRRDKRVWAVYGLMACCLIAYTLSQVIRPHGQAWPWLDDWGVAAFEIVAAGLCLLRGFTAQNGRIVPLSLGVGLLSWAIGDFVLAIESSGGSAPSSPSLADGFYLAFYPITYVALMMLVRQQIKKLTVATWLDGAVAGIGAAALCAAFAFRHVLQTAGGGIASVAVNLAYPVGDVLLLGIVVAGTAVLPGRKKAPWLLLAMGYMINALGDTSNLFHTGIGSSRIGTLLDAIAWPTSILLISLSVWLRSTRSSSPIQEEPERFVLPACAAASALSILFFSSIHHDSRVAIGLAAATLVIAGVRAGLSLLSLREVTAERQRQAITDQLTGLGNRREIFQFLNAFFDENDAAQGDPRSLAFLYVDLNGFKEVNDSFGHLAGDELLRHFYTAMSDPGVIAAIS